VGRLLAEHGFLAGLSIDGPGEIHDTYGAGKGGEGSFGRVMKGWPRCSATALTGTR
jgi:uncharacterized protein